MAKGFWRIVCVFLSVADFLKLAMPVGEKLEEPDSEDEAATSGEVGPESAFKLKEPASAPGPLAACLGRTLGNWRSVTVGLRVTFAL
eukprot:2093510-Rhodomonas_salina.3